MGIQQNCQSFDWSHTVTLIHRYVETLRKRAKKGQKTAKKRPKTADYSLLKAEFQKTKIFPMPDFKK